MSKTPTRPTSPATMLTTLLSSRRHFRRERGRTSKYPSWLQAWAKRMWSTWPRGIPILRCPCKCRR